MSSRPLGAAELEAALAALSIVAQLTVQGRERYDRSPERRLALAFCWVSVGSSLKQYSRLLGVPTGIQPLAGPIRMRDKLAYQAIGELDAEVLWQTCRNDTEVLARFLTDLRTAL